MRKLCIIQIRTRRCDDVGAFLGFGSMTEIMRILNGVNCWRNTYTLIVEKRFRILSNLYKHTGNTEN